MYAPHLLFLSSLSRGAAARLSPISPRASTAGKISSAWSLSRCSSTTSRSAGTARLSATFAMAPRSAPWTCHSRSPGLRLTLARKRSKRNCMEERERLGARARTACLRMKRSWEASAIRSLSLASTVRERQPGSPAASIAGRNSNSSGVQDDSSARRTGPAALPSLRKRLMPCLCRSRWRRSSRAERHSRAVFRVSPCLLASSRAVFERRCMMRFILRRVEAWC